MRKPRKCSGTLKAFRSARPGVILMEVMIGVAIFAIGVIMLSKCVSECLKAEAVRMEEREVRTALTAAMAEVLASNGIPDDKKETELEGTDPLITILQERKPLRLQNEQKVEIPNLFEVTLTAKWESHGSLQEQPIHFTVYRSNQAGGGETLTQ